MFDKDKGRGYGSDMPVAKDKIRVNVTFTREENELLKKVAEKEGRSVSNYIRFVVLKDAEDLRR